MRAHRVSLIVGYTLAGLGAAALGLAPIPVFYSLAVLAAATIGLFWDIGEKHFLPRWLLNLAGLAGGAFTLVPLRRETLAEQSLAALGLLLAVKLLESKESRDYLQILALSLMMVAGGASLSPDLVYGSLFLVDLALGTVLLLWLPFAREIGRSEAPGPLLARLGWVSALLFLGSLPLALAIFTFLPRALNPFWMGFAAGARPVSGFSDQLQLGQVGRLSLSGATAFRAQMDDPPRPLAAPPYWRGVVMEVTDGRRWSLAPTPQSYTAERRGGAARITYFVEPHGERELFILEQPLMVVANFRTLPRSPSRVWRLSAPLLKPIRYQGFSRPSDRRSDPLLESERRLNLSLPADFSPRIAALSARLAGGETDPAVAAGKLTAFFASGFVYSLDVPRSDGDPLEAFLFSHLTGYCEYFASALALMLRSAGIPARLVGGYLGGEYNPAGGYYLVRQSAAHTWVEAWLPGSGWTRLDPTPAAGELGMTLASRRARKPRLWLDALRMKWNSWVVQYDTETQVEILRLAGRGLRRAMSFRGGVAKAGWAIAGLAAMACLAAAVRFLPVRRQTPWKRRYARFLRIAAGAGAARLAHEGPIDHARRLGEVWPAARPDAVRLAGIYAAVHYGGATFDRQAMEEMDRLLAGIRRAPRPGH